MSRFLASKEPPGRENTKPPDNQATASIIYNSKKAIEKLKKKPAPGKRAAKKPAPARKRSPARKAPAKKDTAKKPADSKLTVKMAGFAFEYVKLGNASQAYREAYDAANMSPEAVHVAASRLLANAKVTLRVDALRAELATRHLHTLDSVVADLVEIRDQAMNGGKFKSQLAAAVSATMAIAKLIGLDQPMQPGAVDGMPDLAGASDKQMDALAAALDSILPDDIPPPGRRH